MFKNQSRTQGLTLPKCVALCLFSVTMVLLSACSSKPQIVRIPSIPDATIKKHATGDLLDFSSGTVITGNDAAFRSKLELVKTADKSLDLMYYIFDEDYTSSVLAAALVEAAKRGVQVRLLLDYHANYKHLDFYSMLAREGSKGKGNLQVKFYNRPTREIIIDAAYLASGCPGHNNDGSPACADEKLLRIQKALDAELAFDGSVAAQNISNIHVGNSGMFLSGLYAKNPKIMSLATLASQTPKNNALFKQLAANNSNLTKELPKLHQLPTAMHASLPAENGNPIYDIFGAYLPTHRTNNQNSLRDWEFLTDYMHQKLILADNRLAQLGGRNIGDHYHMRPNKMGDDYMFRDTDIRLDLTDSDNGVIQGFERLWDFRQMVASLEEVRQHAPNDVLANPEALQHALTICGGAKNPSSNKCIEHEFSPRAFSVQQREDHYLALMQDKVQSYNNSYPFLKTADNEPQFSVDKDARVSYIENIPFSGAPGAVQLSRTYGAVDGMEALSGKRINSLWIAGLDNICRQASTSGEPQSVIFHNAYFAPSANLIRKFAQLVSGETPCPNVTITVLSNSIETTNLTPVNILARRSVKAFAEYVVANHDPENGAKFKYYTYIKDGEVVRSLHSKVSVFGADIMIGSANADLRSYIMDANNAVYIQNAPMLSKSYRKFVSDILNNPSMTAERTDYYVKTPVATMEAQDKAMLGEMFNQYKVQRWLNPAQIELTTKKILGLLNHAYELSRLILQGDQEAAREYDRLFKTI